VHFLLLIAGKCGAVSALAAVIAGGEAGFAAEGLGEMAGIGVTDIEGDRDYAVFGLAEKAAGGVHSQISVIARGRHAGGAFEETMEMEFAEAGLGGELVEIDFLGEVFRHPIRDLLELEPWQGGARAVGTFGQFGISARKVDGDGLGNALDV